MPKILIIFLSAVLTLNAQANHSLSFDGVDDWVQVDYASNLDLVGDGGAGTSGTVVAYKG